jgi:membrane protein YqaA with SNARE-associated domain
MKKASAWLLVISWISAVLGGLAGIFIGAHLAPAKATAGNGERTFKYDDYSRRQGIPMLVIGLMFFAIGVWLRTRG